MYMSRIRGPYVRFCERDEAVTPHPTRCGERDVCIQTGRTKNSQNLRLIENCSTIGTFLACSRVIIRVKRVLTGIQLLYANGIFDTVTQ